MVPRLTWKFEEKSRVIEMESLASFSKKRRGEGKSETETSLDTLSFISRCEKTISGTSLKTNRFFFYFYFFLMNCLLFWSIKVMAVTLIPGNTDAERERSQVVDNIVLSASGRRPDIKFWKAKRSLAPHLITCWIRPRDCDEHTACAIDMRYTERSTHAQSSFVIWVQEAGIMGIIA